MPRRQRRPQDDPAHLLDMIDAARAILGFVQGKTLADYQADLLLRSAVERQLEVLGEAARRVSDETRTRTPEIAWEKIIRTRHRVSHEYDTLDHTIVWRIATEHLPVLVDQLKPRIPGRLF
ncbi:MAG TPA: HepT-like ribonuclease domain-containing protein [Phycisphaerales bacterium]|nr:HepT-like ribonuclease domain-containing protein [Phycisphaerales bacterium]